MYRLSSTVPLASGVLAVVGLLGPGVVAAAPNHGSHAGGHAAPPAATPHAGAPHAGAPQHHTPPSHMGPHHKGPHHKGANFSKGQGVAPHKHEHTTTMGAEKPKSDPGQGHSSIKPNKDGWLYKSPKLGHTHATASPHKDGFLYKSPKLAMLEMHAKRIREAEARLYQALRELRALEHTLRRAEHDYGGHRTATLAALLAAQQQLHHTVTASQNKQQPATGMGQGTTGNTGALQSLSNQEIMQAMTVLQEALAILRGAEHEHFGNRAAAVRDLDQAILQLRQALNHHHNKGSASAG